MSIYELRLYPASTFNPPELWVEAPSSATSGLQVVTELNVTTEPDGPQSTQLSAARLERIRKFGEDVFARSNLSSLTLRVCGNSRQPLTGLDPDAPTIIIHIGEYSVHSVDGYFAPVDDPPNTHIRYMRGVPPSGFSRQLRDTTQWGSEPNRWSWHARGAANAPWIFWPTASWDIEDPKLYHATVLAARRCLKKHVRFCLGVGQATTIPRLLQGAKDPEGLRALLTNKEPVAGYVFVGATSPTRITAITNDLILHDNELNIDLNFGQWTVHIDGYDSFVERPYMNVAPCTDPLVSHNGLHPHVDNSGHVCLGGAGARQFTQAAKARNVRMMLQVVRHILGTFGAANPYHTLRSWIDAAAASTDPMFDDFRAVLATLDPCTDCEYAHTMVCAAYCPKTPLSFSKQACSRCKDRQTDICYDVCPIRAYVHPTNCAACVCTSTTDDLAAWGEAVKACPAALTGVGCGFGEALTRHYPPIRALREERELRRGQQDDAAYQAARSATIAWEARRRKLIDEAKATG